MIDYIKIEVAVTESPSLDGLMCLNKMMLTREYIEDVGIGEISRGIADTIAKALKKKLGPNCHRCSHLYGDTNGNCERYARIGNRPCEEFAERYGGMFGE